MPTTIQPPAPSDTALLIDERAAAIALGISARTLWGLAAANQIPCLRIGRRKLYSISSLREFIRQRESAGIAERS